MMAESEMIDVNGKHERIRERNRTLNWDEIDSERLRALRQSRSAKKGLVTKAQNEVRNLMRISKDISLIEHKLEQAKVIIDDFNEAHDAYHQILTEELTISESNEYAETVNQSMIDLENEVHRWIAWSKANLPETLVLGTREVTDVRPEDSVSNIGSRAGSRVSHASSISAARAKAAAKRAALEAEATNLESLEEIQREELRLQMKKRQLQLKTELAKAQAEELAYIEAESSQVGSHPEPVRLAPSNPFSAFPKLSVTNPTSSYPLPEKPPTVPTKPSLNPDADSYSPKVEKLRHREDQGQLHPVHIKHENQDVLYPPPVKGEPQEFNRADPFPIASFTQGLLEAQNEQNYRLQQLLVQQQQSALAMTLPQPDVPVFAGNPMNTGHLSEHSRISLRIEHRALVPAFTIWYNTRAAK